MKLSQIAAAPKLIELTLDDQETLTQYGEAVTFWTWDRQPLDVFTRLASAGDNTEQMIATVKNLILDDSGQPIMVNDVTLPTGVLIRAVTKITELLGK